MAVGCRLSQSSAGWCARCLHPPCSHRSLITGQSVGDKERQFSCLVSLSHSPPLPSLSRSVHFLWFLSLFVPFSPSDPQSLCPLFISSTYLSLSRETLLVVCCCISWNDVSLQFPSGFFLLQLFRRLKGSFNRLPLSFLCVTKGKITSAVLRSVKGWGKRQPGGLVASLGVNICP